MSKRSSRDVVLFDLDGTLININSIAHLIGQWDEFHRESFNCPANEPMVDFAKLCQKMDLMLIVVSGKPTSYINYAEDWMALRGILPDAILMRPLQNSMSDAQLKPQLVERFLGEYWRERVLFAVEDRDKMVDGWRATGIMCLQCAESLY